MTESNESCDVYALVANIPSFYHSSDLRNYFSQFIESGGFKCFHFRHRPERTCESASTSDCGQATAVNTKPTKCQTTCCIIRLSRDKLERLQKMYHRRHWLDKKGESVAALCFISKIKIIPAPDKDLKQGFKTRGEMKKIPPDRETFTSDDLVRLPEMNPPVIMPNGNVGTPTKFFLQLIQKCQLPPKVISKLGLVFPKMRSNRQYGNVAFDYGGDLHEGADEEFTETTSAKGHEILQEGSVQDNSKISIDKKFNSGVKNKTEDGEESEVDADDCEEWERHEAMYDDPSNQERNKERLYEEELEIVWEKGGPGIVWYTDAQFWDQQEGDEEEKDVDDWDIDMSEYYERGSGDKDARDYVRMRKDMRMEQGLDSDSDDLPGAKIGKFERHTKGVGRKVMMKQGWMDGQGLGSSISGMPDALGNDGQMPHDKRGFGYRGEKLVNKFVAPPAKRKRHNDDSVYRVWSIYDTSDKRNEEESLLRRPEPYNLKCRDGIRFIKSTFQKEKLPSPPL